MCLFEFVCGFAYVNVCMCACGCAYACPYICASMCVIVYVAIVEAVTIDNTKATIHITLASNKESRKSYSVTIQGFPIIRKLIKQHN